MILAEVPLTYLRRADRRANGIPVALRLPAGWAVTATRFSPSRPAILGCTGGRMQSLLIVDGSEVVAELLAEVFGRHGWAVRAYSDAQRAANDLEGRTPYDAVILSQRLPGMPGVELITRIRALDHRKDVPIVMVTGLTDEDMRVAAMAAGADDVWCKPVDLAALVAAVRQRVDAMHPRRERALAASES